jgi:hypothetical protein
VNYRNFLLALVVTFAALLSQGCAYYEYGTPERTIKVLKFGVKTEIGELDAGTPQGYLKLKGLSSDGASVVEKLVDRIPTPMGFTTGSSSTTTVVPVPTPAPAPAPVPAPTPVPAQQSPAAPAPARLPDVGDPTVPVQPAAMNRPRPIAAPATRPATPPANVAPAVPVRPAPASPPPTLVRSAPTTQRSAPAAVTAKVTTVSR